MSSPPIPVSISILAIVAVLFLLQLFGPPTFKAEPGDAMVYWEASSAMQSGDNAIYKAGGWESFGRLYIYPPPLAALFSPFTWFDDRPEMDAKERGLLRPYPFPSSLYVYLAIIGLMWGATMWVMARELADSTRERLWLAAAATGCMWGAFYLDVNFGNINTLILLMLAGGLALVLKDKPWPGGMLIGAAAMIKVLPVALMVIFAVQRRWKACAAMFAGAALIWLIPLLVTVPNHGLLGGIAANLEMSWDWISRQLLPSMSDFESPTDAPYVFVNNSVTAALMRLFGEGTQLKLFVWDADDFGPLLFALPGGLLKFVGVAVPFVMFCVAVFTAWRRRDAKTQWGMAGLAFMAVSSANVLFWHYHFAAFVLPVAAALAAARTQTNRRLAWIGIGALFLLSMAPNVAAQGFLYIPANRMLVWCIPTLGFLIGWWCLWACLWRSSSSSPASHPAP